MRKFNYFYDYYPLILKLMSKDQAKETLNIRFGGASERSRRYNEIERLRKELIMENNMELFGRLLIEILSGITDAEAYCYHCPLCKLTGIENACEHPGELIAFVKEADPIVIENLIKEVSS